MKKTSLQILALLCLLAVQGFPAQEIKPEVEGRKYYPWQVITLIDQLFNKVYDSLGNLISVAVAPNEWVNIAVFYDETTGYHPHVTGDPKGAQPHAGHWISNTRQITDANGNVLFDYRPNGYSGWIHFVITPENPKFPVGRLKNYLGYYLKGPNGTYNYLAPMGGKSYTMDRARHLDTRHGDIPGGAYVSRYGTPAAVQAMQFIAYKYQQQNKYGLQLDLMRGSLPDGGVADNQVQAGNRSPYDYPEWTATSGDAHMYGTEWDIESPASQAPPGLIAAFVFDLFQTIVYRMGCHAGYVDKFGVPISNPLGSTGYWAGQGVQHINCAAAPVLVP